MERKVVCIVGPTCSGKTSLSIMLAEIFSTEIISADSRQIYKHLTIGTAKPSDEQLKKIKHHFIDELNPDEYFNVSIFEQESLKIIERLFSENKIPVIAGGSGLYIKALVEGIFDSVDTDPEVRKNLLLKKQEYGIDYLYDELKKVDPVSADKMFPQNWKRVIRALEVYYSTGIPIWELQQKHKRETSINFLQYGLLWNRNILYKNIEERVDLMIENGLLDEVRGILSSGFGKELNSLNTVGYKEIISYFNKEISLDKAVELIKRNTRRFAKRQMTWFRKDERIKWINVDDENDLAFVCKKIYDEVIK